MDQPLDVVLLGVAVGEAFTMLEDPSNEVVRHTDIGAPTAHVREDVRVSGHAGSIESAEPSGQARG